MALQTSGPISLDDIKVEFEDSAAPSPPFMTRNGSSRTYLEGGSGTIDDPFFGTSNNRLQNSTVAYQRFLVSAKGRVYYASNVSSETNYDFHRFFINGQPQWQQSGINSISGSYAVEDGDTVEWQYTKDGSVHTNDDRAYLTSLYVVPDVVQLPDSWSINDYYRGGGRVPDFSVNNNVPTSGTISIGDFYGAVNGIEVKITIVGAGGAGGGGRYEPNSAAISNNGGAGGGSSYGGDQSIPVVNVSGGAGGNSAGSSNYFGNAGGNTNFGSGGGTANEQTNGANATGFGCGGAGGGGDADSGKNDSEGKGGNGGSAGQINVFDGGAGIGETVTYTIGSASGTRGQANTLGGYGKGGVIQFEYNGLTLIYSTTGTHVIGSVTGGTNLVQECDAQYYNATSGTWPDISGNGRDLQADEFPGPYNGGSLGWHSSNSGAPNFFMYQNLFTGPASNSFGITNTSGYTIELVCRTEIYTQNAAFKFHGSVGSSRGIFSHPTWTNGNWYFDQGGCCAGSQRLNVANNQTSYQHIILRSTPSRRHIIRNGSIIATNTAAAAAISLNSTPMNVGGASNEYGGINSSWYARLGYWAVHNTGLTDTQITERWNKVRGRWGL
jgi:hypothetical protein